MNVLELLDELEEVIRMAPSVPVVRKVMVDPNEILEIVKDIRLELPDEIQQAQYIRNERTRILDEAKSEYESIIKEAEGKANALIENDEITLKAKTRAEDILKKASENSAIMKMSILDYTDNMLYNLQEKVDQLYGVYFTDMFDELQHTFEKINSNLSASRNEVKDQIYKSQMEKDENK